MSIATYIQETRGEMRHVSWPNRRQVAVFTATVVAVSLVVSLLLGVFDYVFGLGLRSLIRLAPNRAPLELPADLGTGEGQSPGTLPPSGEGAGGAGEPSAPKPVEAPKGPALEFEPI
jgi:preprotein translocase subunit SecE